jgi:hypothetical protein
MTRTAANIYRWRGELSLGGTGLGYLGGEALLTFDPGYGRQNYPGPEATNTIKGSIFTGFGGKGMVELLEWSSTTLAKAFPGIVSGSTVTASNATVYPGTNLATKSGLYFSLSWSSDSGDAVLAATKVLVDPKQFAFGRRFDNVLPVDFEVVDGSWSLTLS